MKKWQLSESKTAKTKIPTIIKNELTTIAEELIEHTLKPAHIKPQNKNVHLNQLVDIFIKWRGNSLFFYAKYNCYGENVIAPSFESKFARLIFIAEDKFNLSYMRHNDQWFELHRNFTGQACCNAIANEPYFVV
jgi:hypothetical protein